MTAPLEAAAAQLAGYHADIVDIPTANPVNHHQAIAAPGSAPVLRIHALLAVPSSDGPAPAVMVVPGSAGVSPNHVTHAATLLAEGYAVCLVDPFTDRSVSSTVANQTQYSFAASAFDVLATLRLLAADPRIDPTRIAAQGHSRGGAAVLTAAVRSFADPIVGDLALAGVYAAYPWCGQQFLQPHVGRTVVRAIIGDRDDWGSVMAVQAQIRAMALTGADATMRLVSGAHHSFDRTEPVHAEPDARVSPHAPLEFLADDGSMIDPYTGVPDPERTDRDQFRAAYRAGFAVSGAHLGGQGDEPELFRADMLQFHARVLRG